MFGMLIVQCKYKIVILIHMDVYVVLMLCVDQACVFFGFNQISGALIKSV